MTMGFDGQEMELFLSFLSFWFGLQKRSSYHDAWAQKAARVYEFTM